MLPKASNILRKRYETRNETVNLSPNHWFLYAILEESKQNLFPSDLLLKRIEFEYKQILFNIKNEYLFFNFGELDESKFSVRKNTFFVKTYLIISNLV